MPTNNAPTKILDLDNEFQNVYNGSDVYHGEMGTYLDYYYNSVFYSLRKGERLPRNQIPVNLLQTFADKNIQHTSRFPEINVPSASSDLIDRQTADMREKILLGTWRQNGGEALQRKWAGDATLQTVAVAETYFDTKQRCVVINRYDPRSVYWSKSNTNDDRAHAVFIAFPITKDEVEAKYGVRPDSSGIDPFAYDRFGAVEHLDDREWVMQIIRLDGTSRTVWAGDVFLERPHKHFMGVIPIDMCFPFVDHREVMKGDFYLRPLIPLQAEINHAYRMRSNIIRKMGAPAVWARGLYSRQLEEVARALQGDGGLVGLKGQGDLGILSPPETNMIDAHIQDLITQMMRLTGYNQSSFGESVGANASGDTYGMLFAPTIRSIEYQQAAWSTFYQSINSKILYLYEKFLKSNEKIKTTVYKPRGTVLGVTKEGKTVYSNPGLMHVEFDKSIIQGVYDSDVDFGSPAPRDELEEHRLWYEMATAGQISKIALYEKLGIQSPEEERNQLEQEQMNPAFGGVLPGEEGGGNATKSDKTLASGDSKKKEAAG